jgi:adenylate cyclase
MPTMHLDRLPEGITATPRGEIELRGFPGSIEVVQLTGVPTQGERNDTGELWTRTPYI